MSYGRQMGYGPPLGAVIPKSTYDAIVAPTVNEDSGDGYSVGSRLIDIVLEHEHVLVNPAAGAAVWKPTTYTTSAGMPDPYTPPDGDWDVTGSISATVDVSAASFTGGTATLAIAAAGDALAIALATDLTNQAIVSTEDDVIRTAPMWEATRQASATGSIATLTKLAIGTTTAAAGTGVLLQNTTDAAAAGNQQYSPLFLLGAEGWRTNVTAETQTVQMGWQVQPVQGAASPTGNLVMVQSIDGGAFGTEWQFTTAGHLQALSRSNALVLSPSDTHEQITSDAESRMQFICFNAELMELAADQDFTLKPQAGHGVTFTQKKVNAASTPGELLTLTGAAHGDVTPIAASTQTTDVLWDFDRTITYATGALAEHSAVIIKAPELAFAGASTVAKAYTVKIEGPPTAGANCTLAASDTFALYVVGSNIAVDSTQRYYFDGDQATPNDFITAGAAGQIDIWGSAAHLARFSATSESEINPWSGYGLTLTQAIETAAVPNEILTVTGAAHTTMTASTEATSMLFDFGQTMQWATGALASNATVKFVGPTLGFVGASTVSKAYTVTIAPPAAGANCTLTAANTFALYCGGNIGLLAGARIDFRTDGGEYIYSASNNNLNIVSGSNVIIAGHTNPSAGSTYLLGSATDGWARIHCELNSVTTNLDDNSLGVALRNETAATVGAQKYSPDLRFHSYGWETNVGSSMEVEMGMQLQPVQGAAAPTGNIVVWENINDAAYNILYRFESGGAISSVGEFTLAPDTGYGVSINQTAAETTTPAELLTLTGATIGGVTPITASTEYTDAVFNFAHTVTFATGALGSQRACRIEGPTYAFAGASVITNCATLYLTAPIAGANCTITNRWALWTESGNIRSDGNIYTVETAAADPHIAAYGQWWVLNSAPCMPMFDDDTGTERSIITGLGTSGAAIRAGTITVTGTGDNTTCTAEMFNDWNSEALAVETIDSDFPTGGTRFDLSADKLTITAKGITKVALISLSHHIHSSDVGVDWNVHVGIAGGKLTITANVATTGVAVDFAAAALNGKIIDFNFTYLTSD